VWEEAGEEGSCSRKAGAYYCYVAFDCGPGCCAGVVVWFCVRSGFGWLDGVGNLQVGSVELEMIRRDFRRRILVMRTLDRSEG
jgi:hypothetical protein